MNQYLFSAGILCFLLALIHSILGEYLIFQGKRKAGELVPRVGGKEWKKRHLGIIWASWHVVSLFGMGIGAIILHLSNQYSELSIPFIAFVINVLAIAMTVSAALVFIGTKGRHPGWIVLLLIAALLLIGK